MNDKETIRRRIGYLLSESGVIGQDHLDETVELAWPRVVTGFAIMSMRTVDLALIGIVLGASGVAGLAVANSFWMVGKFAYIGLAGGTLSLVSQNFGGGDNETARAVVVASFVGIVVVSIGLIPAFMYYAHELIATLSSGSTVTQHGARYLLFVAPALFFEGISLIGSRTYAAIGNTLTPMYVRASGAVLNIMLSVIFVFGFNLDVIGVALGTTVSTVIVSVAFLLGIGGMVPWSTVPQVQITQETPLPSSDLFTSLLSVSAPLVGRRIAQGIVVFPLLWIAGNFGAVTLAALGVARQIRNLLNSFSWGFSIAASTLVGQSLGNADETAAAVYGTEIIKFSAIIFVGASSFVMVGGQPIAGLFVSQSQTEITTQFIQVAAVSGIAAGVDGSISGVLRGAGDTHTPFYATLVGSYLIALPLAWGGTVTMLGVNGLLLALIAEKTIPVIINGRRFRTGSWKEISRQYRPSQHS